MPSDRTQRRLWTLLVFTSFASTLSATAAGASQARPDAAEPELSTIPSDTSSEAPLPPSPNGVERQNHQRVVPRDEDSQSSVPPERKTQREPNHGDTQTDSYGGPRPQPAKHESSCNHKSHQVLSDSKGSVEWTQPVLDKECTAVWEWVLSAPAATNGLVLEFNLAVMRNGLTFSVHEVDKRGTRPKHPPVWVYRDTAHNYYVLPIFIPKNRVMVIVKTKRRQSDATAGGPEQNSTNDRPRPKPISDRPRPKPTNDRPKQNPSNDRPKRNSTDESPTPSAMPDGPSRVNFSYAAHPLQSLPIEVYVHPDKVHSSKVLYSCPSNRDEIPEALTCDMIEQCVGGEDEAGCSYKDSGCGDHWIPYADRCLRMSFQPPTNFTPGWSHVTMPFKAEKVCRARFQATLATFPDEEGIQLVNGLVRRSGYRLVSIGLRKMRPMSSKMKHLYRFLFQWGPRGSPVAHEQTAIQRKNPVLDCAVFDVYTKSFMKTQSCDFPTSVNLIPDGFVCMKPNTKKRHAPKRRSLRFVELHLERSQTRFPEGFHLKAPLHSMRKFPTKRCPDGSLIQRFHGCDWEGFRMTPTSVFDSIFPTFSCTLGHNIHYSLVCDAVDDCADGSDEISCKEPRFNHVQDVSFTCNNMQVIPIEKRCNAVIDCFDKSDEDDCSVCAKNTTLCASVGCVPNSHRTYFASCHFRIENGESKFANAYPPSAVELDGFGMSRVRRIDGDECEEGYFQCDSGLCIPMFLVNNEEQDCPSGMDESIAKENFTCPGYYRCHRYGNCVHSRHLCDGIAHCPNHDDERYCDLTCPSYCECEGYAYKCSSMIDPYQHLKTRLLDVSGVVGPDLKGIRIMRYLMFLNLSNCQLEEVKLTKMPHLEVLDLSYNSLSDLSSLVFGGLVGLKQLSLANNPFISRLDASFARFVKFSGLKNLVSLILANTGLTSIEGNVLSSLEKLVTLDISRNPVARFDKYVFHGLENMKTVYADNYKLCCSYFLYTAVAECNAPVDELSSCSDLLSGFFFQISVWLLATLNIPANVGCMVYRLIETRRGSKSYTLLVANLCLSDLMMGVYLVFIGSADVHYRNVWVSKEEDWTSSQMCVAAGILAFLSSEVSTFIVCLITLERLLVICFPLKVNLHMTIHSTSVACGIAWLMGLLLAFGPVMVGWEFYGQNGFCLPLPITRNTFHGQKYAFAIFIIINFLLFLLIGLGQVVIYLSIKKIRQDSNSNKNPQDTSIALKLMLVVVTDFLCWFPIGLMGLLVSLGGVPLPSEVNVWAALFILPFNSALNPHLYTINTVINRHREQRFERRIQKTIGKIDVEIEKWPSDKVEKLLKSCLRTRVVRKEKVLHWLSDGKRSHDTEACQSCVTWHEPPTANSDHMNSSSTDETMCL